MNTKIGNAKLLIYEPQLIEDYLHFIKANISLIREIYEKLTKSLMTVFKKDDDRPMKSKIAAARSKHFQIMTLIGVSAEHLVKIILLKRGFVLNTGKFCAKFSDDFMDELKKCDEKYMPDNLDKLYLKIMDAINLSFKNELISFEESISFFENSNPVNYYEGFKTYVLNPNPEIYDGANYFGFKEIKPESTLKIIQKMRNSYVHLLKTQMEQVGVIRHLFNFIIWLCKKEYPDFFKGEQFITNRIDTLR